MTFTIIKPLSYIIVVSTETHTLMNHHVSLSLHHFHHLGYNQTFLLMLVIHQVGKHRNIIEYFHTATCGTTQIKEQNGTIWQCKSNKNLIKRCFVFFFNTNQFPLSDMKCRWVKKVAPILTQLLLGLDHSWHTISVLGKVLKNQKGEIFSSISFNH